ncbi:MAG: Ig-like domain-containing protein, partial [Geobacteraceae bacterium]|nr:Ig-like domain-containing protein [Geobacteraceae bacterium]
TYGYKSWNVTGMVREWVASPSGNLGLLLNSSTKASSDSNRMFASSEATDATQRPKLVVTYVLASDATAPTVNTFTLPTTATSLTVPITAFTATDEVGVTGYLVTESSTQPSATAIGWSTSAPSSFTFSSAGTKTAYAWAKDAAGNVSGSLSRTVTITLPDTTAPTVSITSPSANSVVRGSKTIYASASDNVKVTKVEFYVNGVLKLTSGSSPFKYSWNTRTVGNGTCGLMAKAYDAAGNMQQSSTVSVRVKN